MPGKPVLVCTLFVGTNPLKQVVQLLILLQARTKLLRFPRSRAAVGHACIYFRVKEDTFIAVDQYRFYDVRVAAFDDPVRATRNSMSNFFDATLKWPSLSAAVKRHLIK
jgi:hypothetical protein